MPNGLQVGIGKNILYGILFFVVFAVACGLGGFIGIIMSNESTLFLVLLFAIMLVTVGPIVAMIIGVVQGKIARNGKEAMIAGGVTGIAGFILLIIILFGLIFAAVAIKYPGDGDGDGGDGEVDINLGEMAGQLIATFMPSGIIGAFSAFFSSRYVFAQEIAISTPYNVQQYQTRAPPPSEYYSTSPPHNDTHNSLLNHGNPLIAALIVGIHLPQKPRHRPSKAIVHRAEVGLYWDPNDTP